MKVLCTECPLRKSELFTSLSTEELKFLLEFKTGELRVEAGSPILTEGAASPYLYTVLSGFGLRTKLLEDGRRQVLNFIYPGDFLGLQTALLGEMGHSVDASSAMTLCVFPRERIWDLFKSSPRLAYQLTWLAAREEHFLGEALITVGQKTAIEKVAAGLATLYSRARDRSLLKRKEAPMPWRQQDLADALGLSLVHTNKTLRRLRDDGLAVWNNGGLQVKDLSALAERGHISTPEPSKRPLL